MPLRQHAGVAGLRFDNFHRRERTDHHDDGDGGKDQRDFVADHLRNRPHRAEQRVFVAARPTGHEHGQLGCRADREEKQHAGVEVNRDHVAADGQNGVSQQHRHDERDGREEVNDFVRRARHDVFLDHRFDAVGDELAEAEQADVRERNADAVRAVAILDAAQSLRSSTVAMPKRNGNTDRIGTMERSAETTG